MLFLKILVLFIGQNYAYPRLRDETWSFDRYHDWLRLMNEDLEKQEQRVIDIEQQIEDAKHNFPVGISVQYFDREGSVLERRFNFGLSFQTKFRSGTLDVFLVLSEVTNEGFLIITGPNNFDFGFKWRSTKKYIGYFKDKEWTTCTKAVRSSLAKILSLIDGVKIGDSYIEPMKKDDWINGESDDGSYTSREIYIDCLPHLSHKMKIDAEFDSSVFNGLGTQLTKKEIEKIENAKRKYRTYCEKRSDC